MRLEFPLQIVCRVLKVSLSGFYDYQRRGGYANQGQKDRIVVAIKAVHAQTRETYGAVRCYRQLLENGFKVSLYLVRQLRSLHNIQCKQTRKYKATTNSKHTLPVAENLLAQKFDIALPNTAWVSDITYIQTQEGWLYLAGIKDLCTKEIVGYSLSDRMTQNLVITALHRAISRHRPGNGLLLHSDRGSQYCSKSYALLAKQYNLVLSMSRKGNCYDNAPMESFWGLLKNELIYHKHYKTREQARQDIIEYIEIFYNRQRKQEKLGYLAPTVYAKKLRQQDKLAA